VNHRWVTFFNTKFLKGKGDEMGDKEERDKGKREEQKKGKYTLKEKRKQKKDKTK
jgi:hypothetical protein